MSNPFLQLDEHGERDIETAIMLEKAVVMDIGKAVAYTDGNRVFINTDDNLFNILPAYDHNFLKWLLWHERYHMELRHHSRYFAYLEELSNSECLDKFHLTKDEVNIIMDILVHDSLSRLFPELVETAVQNLSQMRNRNSLGYTFKTDTLEEMLDEYRKYKEDNESEQEGGKGEPEESEDGEGESEETTEGDSDKDTEEEEKKDTKAKGDGKKAHEEGGDDEDKSKPSKPEDGAPKEDPEAEKPETGEHDKTDWTKLEEIDTREFIREYEGDQYVEQVNRLKRKKINLGRLTETLNGLATTTRRRTYQMPSTIQLGNGVILKGRVPGRAKLYLCFDASGSMGEELDTFKHIISKSIPQAMSTPCEWFTSRYGKGTFKDIMPVHAMNGFSDDGDRTIELCFKAEQQGYTPIGVTDGGGQISWSKDMIKQLKRTVLVGSNEQWLRAVQKINPQIQVISL